MKRKRTRGIKRKGSGEKEKRTRDRKGGERHYDRQELKRRKHKKKKRR